MKSDVLIFFFFRPHSEANGISISNSEDRFSGQMFVAQNLDLKTVNMNSGCDSFKMKQKKHIEIFRRSI